MRRTQRPSFTQPETGERKLPGLAVEPRLRAVVLFLVALVAACGGGPTSSAPSQTTEPTAGVPASQSPSASGVVVVPIPSYFVTITESRYGLVSVVTTPGSSCTAEAAMPDGSKNGAAELREPRVANAQGSVSFEYPTGTAATGLGIHTVACSLEAQRSQAQARFEVK